MHAPQILTINQQWSDARPRPSHADAERPPADVCANEDVGVNTVNTKDVGPHADDALTSSRQRIRIHGDFNLPAGETLTANVIATGELRVGPGARLLGSAKGYKDTVLEQGAQVHGSIVSRRTIRLGPGSFVSGPVMAEGDVLIAQGSPVGRPDALTTISSCGIQIAPGCQLHGTVWARVRGNVEA